MTGIEFSSHFISALPTAKFAFLRVSFILSPFLVVHCSTLDFVRAYAPFVVVDSAAQVPIVSVRHPHRRGLVSRSRLLGGGDHGASPRWRRAFQRRRHQPWLSYGLFGVNFVHLTRADDRGLFKSVWNYFRFLPHRIHLIIGRGTGIFHNRLRFISLMRDIRKERLGV